MSLSGPLDYRPAESKDIPLLRRWDEEPHVKAADPDSDWQWEREIPEREDWREQIMVSAGDRPIGFLQIMDPQRDEGAYWGKVQTCCRAIDIWIGEADYLGQGIGTEMMRWAVNRCFSEPDVEEILIDPLASNTRAHRFYERLGFEFVEQRCFDGDDCFVFRLARQRWEDRR